MKIYLVGGAVRDKLLGQPIKERDWVVVGATPDEMIKKGFKPVGKEFPIFLHPKTHEEYALARTERKVGKGYKGFTFYTSPEITLEQDLIRRDLTVNAMALSENEELIDPFGGQKDLESKKLRHVSDAFKEDPVRILRVARFAAQFAPLGFSVVNETIVLMREMVQNKEINALVPERVWQETEGALNTPCPTAFFKTLRECGALKILFPEIEQLYGVPNPSAVHPEIDSGVHTMMVLDQSVKLNGDGMTRFAALLHDLGKGITPMSIWPQHIDHEKAGVSLVKSLCKRLRAPKDYRDLAIMVCQYHGMAHKIFELRAGSILKLLEKTDAIRRPDRFYQFLSACEADSKGRSGYENEDYSQHKFLQTVLEKLKEIPVKPLIEKGLEGNELIERIREKRIKEIKKLRSQIS